MRKQKNLKIGETVGDVCVICWKALVCNYCDGEIENFHVHPKCNYFLQQIKRLTREIESSQCFVKDLQQQRTNWEYDLFLMSYGE